MDVLFTDLDGTLLDHQSYSWEPARPAIERLKNLAIPWVFVTSKTRAEVEPLREQLGNRHPFVVENGAAAFVPHDYFTFSVPQAAVRDDYYVLEWGRQYTYLVSCLKEAAERSLCRVRGFNDMMTAEIILICDLSFKQATWAKEREYDEPFLILDLERERQLLEAIEDLGLHWTKGGRFWHITGENDKAIAVRALRRLFERAYGPVRTIGLGDAINDAPFLNEVKIPILVRSGELAALQAAVPHGLITEQPGPAGWNEAVLGIIRS